MIPRIINLPEKKLVGKVLTLSLLHNKTSELGKSFMPRRNEISTNLNKDLISMSIYPPDYFKNFNFANEFEKWAAAEVSDFKNMPVELESFVLSGGFYAVFEYRGRSGNSAIFQYIFQQWLPSSAYVLDERPHFEILGKNYKNNDSDSEEEIWIPVKMR